MVNQVASVLYTLSGRMGSSIGLTHDDLAHIIGTHRETVSRALHELSQVAIVRTGHGAIEILDEAKLEQWSLFER
jgi:CRP-like cAMP-binding protein